MGEYSQPEHINQLLDRYLRTSKDYSDDLQRLMKLGFNKEQAQHIILRPDSRQIVMKLVALDLNWKRFGYWSYEDITVITARPKGDVRLAMLCEYTPLLIAMGYRVVDLSWVASLDKNPQGLKSLYDCSWRLYNFYGFSWPKINAIFMHGKCVGALEKTIETAEFLYVCGAAPNEIQALVSEKGVIQYLLSAQNYIGELYQFGFTVAAIRQHILSEGLQRLPQVLLVSEQLKANQFSSQSIEYHLLCRGSHGLAIACDQLNILTDTLPGWERIPYIITAPNCFWLHEVLLSHTRELIALKYSRAFILRAAIDGGCAALEQILNKTRGLQQLLRLNLPEIRVMLVHADGYKNDLPFLLKMRDVSNKLLEKGFTLRQIENIVSYNGAANVLETVTQHAEFLLAHGYTHDAIERIASSGEGNKDIVEKVEGCKQLLASGFTREEITALKDVNNQINDDAVACLLLFIQTITQHEYWPGLLHQKAEPNGKKAYLLWLALKDLGYDEQAIFSIAIRADGLQTMASISANFSALLKQRIDATRIYEVALHGGYQAVESLKIQRGIFIGHAPMIYRTPPGFFMKSEKKVEYLDLERFISDIITI